MVDDTGSALKAPELIFDASEIGEEAFGWNIPLALLIPALEARAAELGVSVFDAEVTSASPGGSDDFGDDKQPAKRFRPSWLLAADGRDSILRDAAGIRHQCLGL